MPYAKVRPFVSYELHDGFALAKYLDLLKRQGKVIVYSHLPHETYTTSWRAKQKNKLSGVQKGVPDYLIVLPNRVVFLELKRAQGGSVSPEQKQWLAALTQTGHVTAVVCKGFYAAKDWLDKLIASDV